MAGKQKDKKCILVSFEGIDASGKNTQSRMLFDYLKKRNLPCELMSFPDYSTPIGQEIRKYLQGRLDYSLEARHLLYAANRYEAKSVIEGWIGEEGKIVIINRYSESNLAYGAANGLPLNWLSEVESRMPPADYVFYLRIDPEVSRTRKSKDRDRYEVDMNLLNRVSQVYDALVSPGRWFVIDAARSKSLVHYEIIKTLSALLPERDISDSSSGDSVNASESASSLFESTAVSGGEAAFLTGDINHGGLLLLT